MIVAKLRCSLTNSIDRQLIFPILCCVTWSLLIASFLGLPTIISGDFRVDRLSVLMATYITTMATLIDHYHRRAFEGEPQRNQISLLLFIAALLSCIITIADAMWILALSWFGVSSILYMLQHARLTLTTQRIGDFALFLAVTALALTTKITTISSLLTHQHELAFALLLTVAGAVAVAACARCAIYPFHAWLPESADAPTSIAAFIHSVIVIGGGFLFLRCAPLLLHVPLITVMVFMLGGGTALWGIATMRVQNDDRGRIAASTMSHTGYLLFLCAAGAYAAALLHIIGHGSLSTLKIFSTTTHRLRIRRQDPSPLFALRRSAIAVFATAIAILLLMHSPLNTGLNATMFFPLSFAVCTAAHIARSFMNGKGQLRDSIASFIPLIVLSIYLSLLQMMNIALAPMSFSQNLSVPPIYALISIAVTIAVLLLSWHADVFSQEIHDRTYVWFLQKRLPLPIPEGR